MTSRRGGPCTRGRSLHGFGSDRSAVFGAVYLLVGDLGFIPTFVTGSAPAGMESATGNLLGIFPINALDNPAAVAVLKGIGALYVLLGILGLIFPDGFGLVPLGGADIFLHLGTGAIFLVVAFMDRSETADRV